MLHRESNQGFATFRLLTRHLYQLSIVAAAILINYLKMLLHKKNS